MDCILPASSHLRVGYNLGFKPGHGGKERERGRTGSPSFNAGGDVAVRYITVRKRRQKQLLALTERPRTEPSKRTAFQHTEWLFLYSPKELSLLWSPSLLFAVRASVLNRVKPLRQLGTRTICARSLVYQQASRSAGITDSARRFALGRI